MKLRPFLLLSLLLPLANPASASAAPQAAAPVQGKDYELIAGGEPFAPIAGKIEVAEYFNYICPGCAAFNPVLQQWKAKLPADVHLVYIAADFRGDFVPYARAYYAAESFDLVEKTHDAVYQAIHRDHSLPAEGELIDDAKIAAFYTRYGSVGPEMFVGAMRSFAVDVKLKQARAFAVRSRITSTPSLVVAGKYLVKGDSWDDRLRITGYLIDRERAATKR
jgi:thiol:disulfide interchange protein DsbA